MKLLIGIPTAGNPAAPFLESLKRLMLPPSVTEIEKKTVTGNFVPAERELLADYALERNADYLLMADDDMVIPENAIELLLESFSNPRTGVAGALYYSRDGLRPMVVEAWDPHDTSTAAIPAFEDIPAVVDGVGFGLVVIRTSVLRKLAPPYFPVQVYIERSAGRVRICNEDYLFCKRAREDGWDVLLHPGVRCGHYDRASGVTQPTQWESVDKTNVRRMFVRRPDGAIGMTEFISSGARMPEVHRTASLEYIEVS